MTRLNPKDKEIADTHASIRDVKRQKKKRVLDNRKSIRLISKLGQKQAK